MFSEQEILLVGTQTHNTETATDTAGGKFWQGEREIETERGRERGERQRERDRGERDRERERGERERERD